MKGLTDIPGILVGHASDYDGLTGCTVVLCEQGAVAGGDIRGSATGVDDWDVLSPMHVTPRIHGVVFSGGSARGACPIGPRCRYGANSYHRTPARGETPRGAGHGRLCAGLDRDARRHQQSAVAARSGDRWDGRAERGSASGNRVSATDSSTSSASNPGHE